MHPAANVSESVDGSNTASDGKHVQVPGVSFKASDGGVLHDKFECSPSYCNL